MRVRLLSALALSSAAIIDCGGRVEPEPADGGIEPGLSRGSSAGGQVGSSELGGFANGGMSSLATRGSSGSPGVGNAELPCNAALEERRGTLCVAKSVPVLAAGIKYSIDATEVTRAQYEAWLETEPDNGAQEREVCAGNDTFGPLPRCMEKPTVCHGSSCRNHPQVCVDWCDAVAYCSAVGKRLCGRIGGGSNAFERYADASSSQWFASCSSGGVNEFPYAGRFQEKTCNGYDFWGDGRDYGTLSVASLTGCQPSGQYSGVFDLSGNVYEWEDACMTTTSSLVCRLRGGAFHKGSDCLGCADDGADNYSDAFVLVGFRCCSL